MRRRFLIAAFGLISLFGGLAACSYIFESTIPESDILPTVTPEGGSGIDANDPDAGGCPDRLCDGGFIPDANPFDADIPFCETAGTSLFCADFDDNASAGVNTFGTPQTTAGARLEVATTISLSPRRSMLSVASGNGASAALVHPLGASPSDITIASSILVTAYNNATESRLTMLRITDGGATSCLVWLGTNATNFTLTQLCTTGGVETAKLVTDTPRAIDRGRWHRFSIALKLAPTKTLTLDVDNVRVADVAALDQIAAQPTDAIFGIQNLVGANMTLFQDNLRVTSP